MPVKLFVSRDSEGRPWPPDQSFEVRGCLELVKRLWRAFYKQDVLYAVAANLHVPSADVVILCEHGLGVMEFKHYPGKVVRIGNAWFADGVRIKAGASDSDGNSKYENPHEQVNAYASVIRDKLIHPKRAPGWLPGNAGDWEKIKIQTAVCFTHPMVNINAITADLQEHPPRMQSDWEEFSVITLDRALEWVAELQFGLNQGKARSYEPHRLTASQIINIVTYPLKTTEWTEIVGLMPTGEPYAFLALVEDGVCTQVFGLDRDEALIGRNSSACAVPIPQYFKRVGRVHARLVRTLDGIFLEDLNSTNGTFIDTKKIAEAVALVEGKVIELGGAEARGRNCQLVFLREVSSDILQKLTETTNSLK